MLGFVETVQGAFELAARIDEAKKEIEKIQRDD